MSEGKDLVRLLVSMELHYCRGYGNVERFNEELCGRRGDEAS